MAQQSGYRAFIPSPLPPDPPLGIDGQLQQRLSEADRALGRLDGSIHTLPNPDLFVYDRLQAVRDSGDWEGWLEFFLRGVSLVSAQAADTARRILQHLYEHPIVSARQIQALIGTTFAAANQIVRRLVDIGILKEITGHARHRRFRYELYVRLFDEQ